MWEVEYTDEFGDWWSTLDDGEQEKITAAVETLQEHGPNLKRPVVGKLEGTRPIISSRSSSRPRARSASSSPSTRDHRRSCCLAATRPGNWKRWYDENIPAAEDLYDTYLAQLESEGLI